jgi:CubicO group peptidase (beta-lactamase class C family)
MSYEELIQRRICTPLGMTETRVALPDALKSRLAEGHDIDGNPLPPWDIITLAGCGGLRSNVRDLVRFVQANLGLAKSPLAEAMETTHKPRLDIGPDQAICLGWHLRKAEGILWHNGQTGGYHSFVGLRKSPSIGVVVLGNSAGGTVDAIGYRLLDLLAGKEPKPLPIKVPPRVDPAILEQYVGNYELYPNFILSVTRTGDRLWVQATNQPRLGIYPESETKFSYRAVNAQITFARNKEGKVDKLTLHQHGLDLPAWKGGMIVNFGGRLLKGLKGVGGPSAKKPEPKPEKRKADE